MKFRLIIFISIVLTNTLVAQSSEIVGADFYWIEKDSNSYLKVKFADNGQFEFFGDYFHKCSPSFFIYGRGEYQVEKDSIHFNFDSIPHLESECNLDSIFNEDEYINLKIDVVDQYGEELKNVNLHWGQPKRKKNRITAQSFEKNFDESVEIRFAINEKVNFVRIKKDGYYSVDIKIPQYPGKDYEAYVVLRPQPEVKSEVYFSNLKLKLPMLSECEIQYFEDIILTNKNCQ